MINETLTTNGPGTSANLTPGLAHIAVRFSNDFDGDPGSVRLEYSPSGTAPADTEAWASIYTFIARRGQRQDIVANVGDPDGLWRFSLSDMTAGSAWVSAVGS
jgi:hypothetical protein